MPLDGINDLDGLAADDLAVLRALEPGGSLRLVAVPDAAKVGEFEAGAALGVLKKRGWLRITGQGTAKTASLTPEGEAAHAKACAA